MNEKNHQKKNWPTYFAKSQRDYALAGQLASILMNNIFFELSRTPPEEADHPDDSDRRFADEMKYLDKLKGQLVKARRAAIEARTLWEESEAGEEEEEE